MSSTKPLALLCNDDGYDCPGLLALAEAVSTCFEVVVVAPRREQSATSHSLSLHEPLRAFEIPGHDFACFAIEGTPADCVFLALHTGTRFLPRRPAIVLSGINRGLNLGQDTFYSGTIAAAREAALRGIPALALSAARYDDLPAYAQLGQALAVRLLEQNHDVPEPLLLSLNIPAGWRGGVEATRLGRRLYDEVVEVRLDPRGREYFWIGGPGVRHEREPGTDTEAHDRGLATLSPLSLNLFEARHHVHTSMLTERLCAPGGLSPEALGK